MKWTGYEKRAFSTRVNSNSRYSGKSLFTHPIYPSPLWKEGDARERALYFNKLPQTGIINVLEFTTEYSGSEDVWDNNRGTSTR